MSGTGSDAGSLRALEEGNVRLVEERPCNVNGRSRSRAGSEGPFTAMVASVDGVSTSFAVSCVRRSRLLSDLSVVAVVGRGDALGEPSLTGICGKPGLEKASLKAGLCSMCVPVGLCLDGVVGSWERDWSCGSGKSSNSMSDS